MSKQGRAENRTKAFLKQAESEQNRFSQEKPYNVFRVVGRMLQNMKEKDPKQFGRIAVYTIFGWMPLFMGILLPKIAIGILEWGDGSPNKVLDGMDSLLGGIWGKGTENSTAGMLIIAMAIYFIVAGVVSVITSYLSQYMQGRNMRLRMRYLSDMSEKLQTMDYCYHEDAGFFEKYQKGINACNDNANGMEGLYGKLCLLPAKFVMLAGMAIMAGALNPLLLVALVAHVAVTMWTSKLTHDYEYSKKEEISKAQRRMGYYRNTSQDFSYGKDIRIFNLRERIMNNYQEEINAYLKLLVKIKNREYLLGFAGIVTLLVTNLLTYGILVNKVLNGMPVSSFVMYTSMVVSLTTLMLEFGQDLSFIWNQGEYVNDFYCLIDAPLVAEGELTAETVIKNGAVKAKQSVSGANAEENPATLEIRFDHVTFRYPGTEKNIFTDLNFTIHAGERLAIVGVNGAGKSTLVKLMTGLFAPTEGHVYINGTDIAELKKSELYKLYSAVFQEVNILAFTLRENVACATENVDDDRIREVLEKVGLWNKVEGFENGLDQIMLKIIDENGTDFSGGERQKLSIARALYKNAPMVIMDEPTAALDDLAEAEIYENFSSLVEGKTAVYISHRLASTRFCDKIALFDENGLAEYGNHDELMDLKGKYYEMFVVQGKYYQEAV